MKKLLLKKLLHVVSFCLLLIPGAFSMADLGTDFTFWQYFSAGASVVGTLSFVSLIHLYQIRKRLDALYAQQNHGEKMPSKGKIEEYIQKYDFSIEAKMLMTIGMSLVVLTARLIYVSLGSGTILIFVVPFIILGLCAAWVTLYANIYEYIDYEAVPFRVTIDRQKVLLGEKTAARIDEDEYSDQELLYLKHKFKDDHILGENVIKYYEKSVIKDLTDELSTPKKEKKLFKELKEADPILD